MRRVLLSFITLFLILVGREAYGQCPSPTTISTPGNGSWPVPSGVTSITVEVWGAGGAGGVAGSNPSAGGGGSGGGYVRTNLSVTPGSSINYFVGSGGSGASGSDGQSSWFQTNSSIFAVGGRGAGTSSGIGTGALAVTSGNLGGTLASWYGGAGGNTNGTTTSGGGGASAGTSGNGNPASGSTGGTSTNGSTVGPNGVSGTSNGNSGNSPGSGGSGGIRNSGSSRNGGNGGNGRIIITVNPSAVGAISANQAICSGSSPSNLTVASATGTIQWQRADNLAFTTNVTNVGTNATTLTSAQVGALTATKYFRAVVTNGTCPSVNSNTITVTVNPVSSITAMNTTVCSGDAFTVTPANGTNGVVPPGTTYTWTVPSVSGGITGGAAGSGTSITGTLANPTNTAQTATYTVTPTSGTCAGSSFTVTVTVSPKPAVTNMTSTICSGDSFTATPANGTNGIVPAGTTYTWNAPSVTGGITGGAAGSGSNITGTLTNPTNTAQTATYTVTPTSGSCAGSTFTVTVTVNPRPAVTNMASPACSGDAFTVTPANGTNGVVPSGTTYTWTAPSVSGGITGGAAGSGTSITGTLANPTNTAQTATYTVTPTSGTCAGSSFTVTVTVSPKPAVTNMTSTICSGDSFTATPANGTNGIVPAGTTYTWNAPSVTGGITGGAAGSGSNITGTLTNPTNTAQTATYTVTPTSGSCAGSTFTVTVTVNPRPAVTNMASPACSGDAFIVTPANGTNGVVPPGTTYTWTVPSVSGGITGGVAGSGTSITGTLANPTNTAQTATYTVTPTSGTCAGSSFTVTVTVSPKPAVTNMPSTICSGDSFTATPANGTNGIVPAGTTYTWNAPSVTGGITGGAAGSGSNITGTLTNPTNTAQTATYTVTPTSGSCAGSTFTVTVTVNPRPAINDLNTTTCTGGAFSVSPINGTDGIVPAGISYSWSAPVVTGGVTGGAAGNGAIISGTLTNPTSVSQTATYTVTPSTAECTGTPFTVVVTVYPITSITTHPDNTGGSVCFGDGFSPISVSAVGGNLSYQWYSNLINSNSGGSVVTGATSASFTPPSTPEGSMYYYVVVTGACGSETSNVSGLYFVAPPVTTITQNPSTTAQNSCLNGTFTPITVDAIGAGPSISYQWYSNVAPQNTGGTAISGATTDTFTPPSDVVGTLYYYATAKSDCGTVPTAVSGAITVYPPPTVTNPATASTCNGAGPNISLTASVPSSFSWTIGTITGGITGASAGSGATINQTLTNPSNTNIGTVQYIVTPTSTTGSCPGAPYTITVTVNPTPAVTNLATASTCSGTGPNISLTASVPSSFSWTIGTITGGITGASAGSGATINQTLTNPSNATAGTVQYIVTPTSITGSCTGAPYTITVTVNPQPAVTNSTLTQTICSGASTSAVPITSTVAGTTFSWTASATAGVSGFTPSGTGLIPVETISTTGTTQGTVTYVITPTANGCAGPSVNYTVLVNPIPTVTNSVLTQTICSGASTTAVPLTSTVAGTTFSWTASATAGVSGFTASGSGPIPIQTISTTGSTQGTVTYVITPIANGCTGPTTNYTVLVNPLASVSAPSVAFPSVCINSPTLTPFTQTTSGVTGIDQPGIPGVNGLPPGISASFSGNTITFSGTATTTGLYSYSIPLSGNCINGMTATGTIDVTPVYNITDISSVSATSIGGTATVFFYGDPTSMLNGTYEISYQIKQANGLFTTHSAMATVTNGRGTFSTIPITSNVDTYTVQILTIKKSTDVCTITLPTPPTTYFGVCSAVYSANSTFYVPANVYSITIEVYGAGGGGGNASGAGGGGYSIRKNIPVTPGEAIGIFVGQGGARGGNNGGVSYATRDSNIADQLGNSLVFANGGLGNGSGGTFDNRFSGENGDNSIGSNGGDAGGPLGSQTGGQTRADGKSPGGGGTRAQGQDGDGGNGLIVISYSCPDADQTDCVKIVDDGSKSGTTIIEYTCDDTWIAPAGLAEFTVVVGSGGGGGGSGEGSGGGGSGSIIQQRFSVSSPYGMPAGSNFQIEVGQGGPGATGINANGINGYPSTFSGTLNGSNINISVPGGGGGGSQTTNQGGSGSSGGGGGASPNPAQTYGVGGSVIPITYSGTNVIVYQGNIGGSGDYSAPQNSVAGGGGGGLIPWGSGNDGQNGKAAGNGQGEGGRGGDGRVLNFGDSTRYFGAGGGGIGRYFNGTDKIGEGGSAGGIMIGGSGNLSGTSPVGYPGVDKTGSGGGAGYYGGGKGGDGVVYIYFFNYRILSVEYLNFDAQYNPASRTGELTWATAKEWENSHFEIERSVDGIKNWTVVGQVPGAGYSEQPMEYAFQDLNLPLAGGNVFYRLRQVDFDGESSYSVTKSIQVPPVAGTTYWRVYPNPTNGEVVNLELLSKEVYHDEPVTLRIISSTGQFELIESEGNEALGILVSERLKTKAAGVYTLEIAWGANREYHKLILRR